MDTSIEESAINYYSNLLNAARSNNLNLFKEIIQSIPLDLFNSVSYFRKFRSLTFVTNALKHNNLEFLQYLESINCIHDDSATYVAAKNGNLEMLQFLHNSNYEWQDETVDIAATYGHLDCIKFAIEHDCPWNEEAILSAVETDRIEVFKYLTSFNRFEINDEIINLCIEYWSSDDHHKGKSECFNYCLKTLINPQRFWNIKFNSKEIIHKVNFDEDIWRELLYSNIDLSKHKKLQKKVDQKKKEIIKLKCISILDNILPLDIIRYCIHIYI